jgi:hypothetical protein
VADAVDGPAGAPPADGDVEVARPRVDRGLEGKGTPRERVAAIREDGALLTHLAVEDPPAFRALLARGGSLRC